MNKPIIYGVKLTTRGNKYGWTVIFPDFPEAITQGNNIQDALENAMDCLDEAICHRLSKKLIIPIPNKKIKTFFKVQVFFNSMKENSFSVLRGNN